MNILFAASEALPFVKTGGLGDVIGALPAEVSKDNKVCVFLPFYGFLKEKRGLNAEFICSFNVPLAWRNCYAGLFRKKVVGMQGEVHYYFIDNEYYFARNCYGYNDDGERFAFFSKSVLEALSYIDFAPDIIHCNDWQTAYIPIFLKAHYSHLPGYQGIKTVFTIHNIEYQGKADPDFLENVLGLDFSWHHMMMHDGLCNAVKGAIVMSDAVTTVSKTYAHEIEYAYFANGLEDVIRANRNKISGIVNGIDTNIFNPENDINIPFRFNEETIYIKEDCKRKMQEKLGLEVRDDLPVISVISRLVAHKGMELIETVFHEIMKLNVQFIVIGNGDKRFEDFFRFVEFSYPGRVSSNIMFDSARASLIYSGSDFLLMPSKSEPCGLSQLIAMRYGVIPIVRETGGLFDTVKPIDTATLNGNGFTFKTYNAHDMLDSVKRATEFYKTKDKLQFVKRKIMTIDNSWKVKAEEYTRLYGNLI